MRRYARPRAVLASLVTVSGLGAAVLVWASLPPPGDLDLGRLFFWTALTLAASLLPVPLPGGVRVSPNTAPLIGAVFDTLLPKPFGAVWVAFLGTFSVRDFRRELPWYGTLYNRMDFVLSTFAAWLVVAASARAVRPDDPLGIVAQIVLAGLAFSVVNNVNATTAAAFRTGVPISRVWRLSLRNVGLGLFAQVPLGWAMAEIGVKVGLWATLLFALPLLVTRYTFTKFVELRELFFGTVSALSQAIDAKDSYTRGHADRVSRIAGAIAHELGLSDDEVELVELGAMLHDIGKIGVEDRILLKPARLEEEEREAMRRHPIYSAAILEPSAQLKRLVPIVRHHHENFDGTGYPDGVTGEQIPIASRIILVADAYEAMTSDRTYRKAIGHQRALEQFHRYQGKQFDPKVVSAFERVLEKRGSTAFETSELPAIAYETVAEVKRRLAKEHLEQEPSHAG